MPDANGFIRLNNVTLSFPHLTKPRAFAPGQPEKYSADFILPKDAPALDEFKQEGVRLATEKWGAKTGAIIEMIKGNKKLRCFGDGNEKIKADDGTVYAGYEEGAYIGASSEAQPDLYDNTGEKLMNGSKLYGGCKVNAIVKPWIQDNKFGKAIRCDLVAIQFVDDGEPFGVARPDTGGMFQPVAGAPDPTDSAAKGQYEF